MKTYYIYHIPGIKIGCTSDLNKRMSDQGFTSWEILEEHTDIHEVSNREIELQKEYGYRVDHIPYWKSVENRPKWSEETRVVWNSESAKHARSFLKNPGCQTVESRAKLSKSKTKHSEELKAQIRADWTPNTRGLAAKLMKKYNLPYSTIRAIGGGKA